MNICALISERVRFDAIAGSDTALHRKMLVQWVKNCISRREFMTSCGGGVFMNVKANMLIAQLPEVQSMYVMPSAADESLDRVCAAPLLPVQRPGRSNSSMLSDLYLVATPERDEREAVEIARTRHGFSVSEPKNMNIAIADLLADGDIVANCRGRMEWGARALGNRSILASADDFQRVDKINQMIKMRDFWMPFALSIREESAKRYFSTIQKTCGRGSTTFAFPAVDKAYRDLTASSIRVIKRSGRKS